jgi:hypothetical protein
MRFNKNTSNNLSRLMYRLFAPLCKKESFLLKDGEIIKSYLLLNGNYDILDELKKDEESLFVFCEDKNQNDNLWLIIKYRDFARNGVFTICAFWVEGLISNPRLAEYLIKNDFLNRINIELNWNELSDAIDDCVYEMQPKISLNNINLN